MIRQIFQHRFLLLVPVLFTICLAPLSVSAQAGDASKNAACEAIQAANPDAACGDASESGSNLNDLIELALNLLTLAAGVIAVIMLIVSGLKYITASGDPSNINSAKNTLIYAIVGLVVVALAQIIVRFVLSKAT